jgi:hypothetical protein
VVSGDAVENMVTGALFPKRKHYSRHCTSPRQ